jgi:hypothetical protein
MQEGQDAITDIAIEPIPHTRLCLPQRGKEKRCRARDRSGPVVVNKGGMSFRKTVVQMRQKLCDAKRGVQMVCQMGDGNLRRDCRCLASTTGAFCPLSPIGRGAIGTNKHMQPRARGADDPVLMLWG